MKKIIVIITILFCLIYLLIPPGIEGEVLEKKLTSNFNQNWLKTIISIEIIEKDDERKTEKHNPTGTGFLIETKNKHLLLTTAKHVIIDNNTGKVRDKLPYRLNDKIGNSILITEEELENLLLGSWFLSETYDLACRFIVVSKTSDIATISQESFLYAEDVQAGTQIFLLGFPLGIRSEKYAKPITRHGIVSRSEPNNLIVDVGFYPGNSGGPVIYVPVMKFGGGLNSFLLNEEKLVGVATQYISYVDVAISAQTGRNRITFEENSGLCNVVPVNAINSLLERDDLSTLDKKLIEIFKKLKIE